jgi:hypothetical protein
LESQTRTTHPGHTFVRGLGAEGTYAEISMNLTEMKSALHVTDADLAQAMDRIGSGRPAGGKFENDPRSRRYLAGVARLFMHVEPGRSPSALLTSLMLIKSTGQGAGGPIGTTIDTANPMALEAAGKRARVLGQIANAPIPGARRTSYDRDMVKEFADREREAAAIYIEHLFKEQRIVGTGQQLEGWVKAHLRDHLRALVASRRSGAMVVG